MSFKFPLATVLRIRESLEEREERALQKIQIEIVRVMQRLEELGVAMDRAHQAREQALQQRIPAGQLHTLLWETQTIADQTKSLLHALMVLEQQRQAQMQIYQAAHRDREMLTEMFTRQQDAYERESARTEQKQLDDIFTARRHRT